MNEEQQYPENNDKSHKHKKQGSGFAVYSFHYELYKAILVNGLKNPTPVQRKVIPIIMAGKDAIVCYKTGSGKTLAYLLPIINKIKCHSKIVGARVLILIPTRDLAQQITTVIKQYIKFTDIKYTLLLGGHTYQGQFESLSTNPDIIVATPGRLMELLQQTDLKLSRVEIIVYDEADHLFENGSFTNQLKQISKRCPISQRLMFSATINQTLNDFAKVGLKQYSYIHQQVSLPQQMLIDAYIIRPQDKPSGLFFILQKIATEGKIIIFSATRYHVDYLVGLVGVRYSCEGIYGKMDMQQRTNALQRFRRGKGREILVVTDVAARGLDIPSVRYVIHYDYPVNNKTFVHRSGRTARKDQSGQTIALISYHEIPYLVELSQFVDRKLSFEVGGGGGGVINVGWIPSDVVHVYTNVVKKMIQGNSEIGALQERADKAFEKFRACRSQVSKLSIKKAKNLQIPIHYKLRTQKDVQQQHFIDRIRNFTPKKSFLQLQRIMADGTSENDKFLEAVEKIRGEEKQKKEEKEKKQKLRLKNSIDWKQILNKDEIKQLQEYRENRNRERLPIEEVEGVEIEIDRKERRSAKKDFKDPKFYISAIKNPNIRTQFDSLPKIKTNQLDQGGGDENQRRRKKQREWNKKKNNFVWKKDREDRQVRDEKGKKAYQMWKKKSKLVIPKIGQLEDQEDVGKAKNNWMERRKYRHGWKENKNKEKQHLGEFYQKNRNNKTKAIEKKYKQRMINKSQKQKMRGTQQMRKDGKNKGRFKGKK